MKRLSQRLFRHSFLKSNVIRQSIIFLGPTGAAWFEPSVEQYSHANKREKSDSTKNTANDRTSGV